MCNIFQLIYGMPKVAGSNPAQGRLYGKNSDYNETVTTSRFSAGQIMTGAEPLNEEGSHPQCQAQR